MPGRHTRVAALTAVALLCLSAGCTLTPPPLRTLTNGTPAATGPLSRAMAGIVEHWRSPSGQPALVDYRFLLATSTSAGGVTAVAEVSAARSFDNWILEARGDGPDTMALTAVSRQSSTSVGDLGPWAIPMLDQEQGPLLQLSGGTNAAYRTPDRPGFEPAPAPGIQPLPLPRCGAAVVRLEQSLFPGDRKVRDSMWTGSVGGPVATPLLEIGYDPDDTTDSLLLDAFRGVDLCAAGRAGGLLDRVAALGAAGSGGSPEEVCWVQGVLPLVSADLDLDGRHGTLTVLGWRLVGTTTAVVSAVWRPAGGAAVLSPPVRAADLAGMRLDLPAGPADVLVEVPGLGVLDGIRGATVLHDGHYPAADAGAVGARSPRRVIVYRAADGAVPTVRLSSDDGVREQPVGAP